MAQNERVDYSELIDAIQNGDTYQTNSIIAELTDRLRDYLIFRMSVDRDLAKDLVQDVFLRTVLSIKDERIDRPKAIWRYLIKAVQNRYYNYMRDNMPDPGDDVSEKIEPDETFSDSDQHNDLLEEERLEAMRRCIEMLSEDKRRFIRFLFEKPDTSLKKIAKIFDMSHNHVRVRKYRIIDRLNDCVNEFFRKDDPENSRF